MPTNPTTRPEAFRLNLEYYRKAAKALLKAADSGDAGALQRMALYSDGANPKRALHEAQLTIAREQGFASWPRFRAFLAESGLDFQGLVVEFVKAAMTDPRRAEKMLARHPELADAGLYTALVLGDRRTVERALNQNPAAVNAKAGPQGCEPLVYVCFSYFAKPRSSRAGDLLETARLLLSRGADPNSAYDDPRWPANPLPCLYAATGLHNNAALGRVLLNAGARPDDDESLYHSTEHADLACVRLLLEFGASVTVPNTLKHVLDYEQPEGLQLLLAAGADPNAVNPKGETALHWAVWRGRSAEIVAALLDAGAEVNARRGDGRTAYALAVRSGQTETAALLKARGADTELDEMDAALGNWAASDGLVTPGMAVPEEMNRLLPEFASSHCTSAVRALLKAGVPIDTFGDYDCTALHWACWKGYADLVEVLLEYGASLTIEDGTYHATPVGWFSHGLQNSVERAGDYPQTARILLAAGVSRENFQVPSGDDAVDAVLMR